MTDRPNLGIQLYSVRSLTEEDVFKETLTALANMGFQGVEFAWKYGGMDPNELARFLRSTGLVCCGLHVQLAELLDPNHLVYEYAVATGSPFITTSLASRVAEWAELVPRIDEAAVVARSKGLQFTYHNHYQEFEKINGVYAQDLMRDQTDSDLVRFELDLGWIRKGGEEPIAYWRGFAGRVPQIHLRDYDAESGQICDIGAGFIDVAAVAAQAVEMGSDWLIYEQDCYPVSPMASAKVCIEQCRAAGLIG